MKKISKTFLGLFCMTLLAKVCIAQTTPIDQAAPGPHIFFETRNFVITNNAQTGPTLKFDLYMSASQTYVDYLLANDPDHDSLGFQAGDVAFDLDFGSNGTTVTTAPNGWQAIKVSNQLSDIQAPQNLAGASPAGYDTKFKFTPYRLPSSDPLTTTPTHVATATMTWPAGVVIGTPGSGPGGAKIQLRCAATGYGTGLSGSKWGDMSGHIQNIIGASSTVVTPLPVKLVDFSTVREGNTAVLSWSTSEESNSDYFEVQRSGDAKTWEKLKSVAAKGESSVEMYYSAVDDSPLSGVNFYRLKMVDKDGTFALSKIRNVEFDIKAGYTLFPNPVSDKLNFRSTEDWNSVASIKIYNAQGVEVYTSPSVPVKEVDVKNLPSGTYVVKLSRKKSRQSQNYKVVIAR
ncbi:T9SS type A sorting domain-containing protein [Dyadobacter fermentans]|uniref:T9SS type A sorting domain-containing protein n=1 Tax=Dyadobacter fermentans TaxID=94254 RepID=UPI001CBD0928|nr:T9SS type A sorting domain-containing protein [Dyadobacter fermentans]MBZ1359789.1 T9SS type A sorting domain-containing protein [Dyadobacter fermentans]